MQGKGGEYIQQLESRDWWPGKRESETEKGKRQRKTKKEKLTERDRKRRKTERREERESDGDRERNKETKKQRTECVCVCQRQPESGQTHVQRQDPGSRRGRERRCGESQFCLHTAQEGSPPSGRPLIPSPQSLNPLSAQGLPHLSQLHCWHR